MGSWTIYSKKGTAKATVKELELHDEWMAECYITLTVVSPTPITFAVGDYLDYRGEHYTIQYDPSVLKKAKSGSYGEGFTYSNIKFVGLQDEIVRCDFNDVVLKDNLLHYTALPTFPFYCESVDDLLDRIQANLEELYPSKWTIIGLNTVRNAQRGTAVGRVADFSNAYKKHIDPTGAAKTEVYGNVGVAETVDNITCWDALKKVHDDFGLNFIIRGRVIIVGTAGVFTANTFKYGKGNGLYEIERIGESDQQIVTRLRAYGSEDNLPSHYYSTANASNLPNNMAVSRLMLPSFPNQSLSAWVEEHKNLSGFEWLLAAVKEGFKFSEDAHRPYIDSPNIGQYGVRPASIYFDGSNETDNIHPTIEGMKHNNAPVDEIYSAEQIEDNGVYAAGKSVDNINIILPELGFELDKVYQDGASIDIKNGMCGARSFKIASVPTKNSDGRWVCNVERVHDESLDLWFPYNDFQIKSGDKFVLTGITMPDAYISSASVKLLKAAIEALKKNHAPRYTYQPRLDEIWMQRQHDKAMASKDVVSLHDTLKAGDIFSFADTDLNIDANIIIDSLTIRENGDGIPTYEVTLRDEKQVGTIQKIANKVDSVISGATTVNAAGGITSRQVKSLIDRFGGEKFLSKLDDDTAQGFITMLKGLQVGEKFVPGLLGEGAIIRKEKDGTTYIEADKLYVRMKAYFDSVETREYKHSAGNRVQSSAGNKCVRVEWIQVKSGKEVILEQKSANIPNVNYFRCYFRASDGEDKVRNNFVIGDQVYCHITSIESTSDDPEKKGLNQKHYWRLCVGRNTEGTLTKDGEAWVDLSNKTSETLTINKKSYTHAGYQTGSDVPEAQDSMIQLGNIDDTTRQGAIIEFVTGADSPSYQIYQGISDFSLTGKNKISLGYNTKTGKAYLNVYGDTYIGDPDGSTFLRYNSATKELEIKAKVQILSSSTIDGSTMEQFIQNHQNNYDDSSVKKGIADAKDAAGNAKKAADNAAGAAKTADGKADKAQKSADGAQKTADGAASAAKTADDKAVAAKKKADEAYNKAATFNYLSQALSSTTEIDGGLILSTLIALRDKAGKIWSGINGAYNENDETVEGGAKGHGIATWFGGDIIDHEATPTLSNFAKSLFRFDGSGYLAGGNISWNKDGKVTIKDIYTDVSGSEKKLGTMLNDLMRFNNAFYFRLEGNNILGIVPRVSFDSLSIAGKAVATQEWVGKNYISIAYFNRLFQAYNKNAKVLPNDLKTTIDNLKLMVGTWTESYLSALGLNSETTGASGAVSDLVDVIISGATKGQILQFDGTHWKNVNANFGIDMETVFENLIGYTTSGKNYAVQKDAYGHLFVNVPWTDNNTTYGAATQSAAGLMSAADKKKLDGIAAGANKYTYTLPTATDKALGGIKVGYVANGKNYAVQLADGVAFVNVPWTDTNTTYAAASQTVAGLMSAADKKKLDGIAEGANKYTYTLPVATADVLGGLKIGYAASGKNYAVVLDANGKAYVNVPWQNTTYTFTNKGATLGWGATSVIATVGGVDIKVTMPANPNTWRGIQNVLTSKSTTESLSAYQGYLLANGSARDNTKLPLAGGTMTGTLTAKNVVIASGNTLRIGDIYLAYDATNNAIEVYKLDGTNHVAANLYARGGISALGETGSAGNSGVGDVTWDLLASGEDVRQIAISHLTTALNGYATKEWALENFNKFSLGVATANALGGVKIGYAASGKNYAVQLDANSKMFVNVPWANTTYSAATQSAAGLMSAADKKKLDGITEGANKYTYSLPKASDKALGGIMLGYAASGKNYAVVLDANGKAYVNVPWTDNNTTYSFVNKAVTLAWGNTSTIATVGGVNITVKMPANPNTDHYAWSDITGKPSTFTPSSHTHNFVVGSYTSNGGQQNPNYFGTNKVGFLMMNTPVNGNSHYKDWIIMDCYSGNDVGGGVAIGVNRQALGAYIMRSAAERKAWAESAELLGTHNYASYAAKKTEAIKSISRSGTTFTATRCDGTTFTFTQQDNNTTYSFSDKNVTLSWGTKSTIATVGGTDIHITMPANPNTWRGIQDNLTSDSATDSLSAKQGKALKASITTLEGYFTSGVAKKAAQLNTARTLWGQSFNGTANVSGNMTGVGNITMAAANGTYIQLGDIRIVYDSANSALKIVKSDGKTAANFYATGGLSALGLGAGGQSGVGDVTWDLLADNTDKRQVALSHLTTALAGYATKDWVNSNKTTYSFADKNVTLAWGTKSTIATVGGVDIHVTLPKNPNTDHYAWADITGKPSTFAPSSHNHNTISSLGNRTTTTTDNMSAYGIYTYNMYNSAGTAPQPYMSAIGFGSGISKIEIAGSWGDDYTGHVYWRSKSDRDLSSYPWKGWKRLLDTDDLGSLSGGTSLPSCFSFDGSDMPEVAENIASYNKAHTMTFRRNAIMMPYQMDDSNDGGFIRVRGRSEASTIMEIGTWDDHGDGETIQFNYYPTTSTINPTHSVSVPKKSGTIALTSDLGGYLPKHHMASSNGDIPTWGTLTSANGYSAGMIWSFPGGSDLAFAYKGGQVSMQVDGTIYQKEGKYACLDTGLVSLELNSSGELSGYGGFIDFHYNGSSADYTSRIIEETSGTLHFVCNIYANGGVTSLSDARHKTIIRKTELSVEQIATMPAIIYKWNDGRKDDNLYAGSIAQNWEMILPQVVKHAGNEESTLSMDYGVAALVSAITTARKVVDHERRIRELEKECERLRTENEQMRLKG